MKYNSREEVERIGRAGAFWYESDEYAVCRALSSFWIYCEPEDSAFTPHLKTGGHWESWILTWFSQNTPVGIRFIDIGSNVGFYTLWAAAHGCRTVIAVDPNRRAIDAVKLGVYANGFRNVEWENVALSDYVGEAEFFIPDGHSGAGSFTDQKLPGRTENVLVYPFDSLWDMWGHNTTMVKIDAEGAEPEIWRGMKECWSSGEMTVVLEWHRDRYDAGLFADELYATADVFLIGYDGKDTAVSREQLLALSDLHMIVLRAKK